MASTYVNDLRLNEMATGDGSGTWGTTTNTNLELIAEAFSYGTEVITTNADTHTTTIADGATDPGRSLYLKYTGTLDSACTITIGPNTVSKVWIIENGTSGSQNIIISQGSGANITIPAGDTKVVYSDGAGAGAAFFDAFANLKVTDPAQTNITSLGTLTGLTTTGDINFGDDDKAIFGAGDDLQIYHDGSNSYIVDNGTGDLLIRAENNLYLKRTNSDETYLSGTVNDAVTLYHNNNAKLATTLTGIDVTGTATMDGLTVDGEGTFAKNQTADTAVEVSNLGTAGATTTASFIVSEAAGTPKGWFRRYRDGTATTAVGFSDKLVFEGAIGSTPTNRMDIDSNGDISFYEDTGTTAKLFWDASAEDLQIGGNLLNLSGVSSGTTGARLNANGGGMLRLASGGVDALYVVDGGNVGIGTTSPASKLDVAGTIGLTPGNALARIRRTNVNGSYGVSIQGNTSDTINDTNPGSSITLRGGPITGDEFAGSIDIVAYGNLVDSTSNAILFYTRSGVDTTTERARIDSSGNLLVGTTATVGTSAAKLEILGDTGGGRCINTKTAITTSANAISFNNGNGQVGSITTNGSATAYNTSSDARLKDVTGEARGLEVINELNPVAYNWKADGKADEGLIAQEVLDIVPNAVSGSEEEMYQMDYSKLVVHLVAGMKEQQTLIESLTARITTLEG
jgi:hypothetical protein